MSSKRGKIELSNKLTNEEKIRSYAEAIGIDAIGFIAASPMTELEERLLAKREAGYQEVWQETDLAKRTQPELSLAGAKSIIAIAISYYQPESTQIENFYQKKDRQADAYKLTNELVEELEEDKTNQNTNIREHTDSDKARLLRGRISMVSWGQDYHRVLNDKMDLLMDFIKREIDPAARMLSFVDTGPLVDRDLASQAGLGFYGYHSCLIHPQLGSFINLGSIVTDLELEVDQRLDETCAQCGKCMDACPTGAIVAPYTINSSRCLAYLTLTKGEAGNDYQEDLSDQLYGCDICQLVCPHNEGVPVNRQPAYEEGDDVRYPGLIEILTMTNGDYKERFGHTSSAWRGRKSLQRNALLLIGKRKIHEALPILENMSANDPRPDIRELARDMIRQIQE